MPSDNDSQHFFLPAYTK